MTDVLDWLTNAMSAAAGTVREQDLRPLTAPERPRRRHQYSLQVSYWNSSSLQIRMPPAPEAHPTCTVRFRRCRSGTCRCTCRTRP